MMPWKVVIPVTVLFMLAFAWAIWTVAWFVGNHTYACNDPAARRGLICRDPRYPRTQPYWPWEHRGPAARGSVEGHTDE